MVYEEVKELLEKNAYTAFMKKAYDEEFLLAGKLQDNGYIGSLSFLIFIIEGKIVVQYWVGQIPIQEPFSSLEEMLEFVKLKFPLE